MWHHVLIFSDHRLPGPKRTKSFPYTSDVEEILAIHGLHNEMDQQALQDIARKQLEQQTLEDIARQQIEQQSFTLARQTFENIARQQGLIGKNLYEVAFECFNHIVT